MFRFAIIWYGYTLTWISGKIIRGGVAFAGVAQLVEHRFCKPAVVGSNPIASSIKARLPSGQRQQTVNLSGFPFDGSNPSLATII